jgi:hypothetical protein
VSLNDFLNDLALVLSRSCIPIDRAEKEEAQLNTPQQQQQQLDTKKAFTNRQNKSPTSYSNKKSLIVNGNGHSTIISRDKFEQHRNRL